MSILSKIKELKDIPLEVQLIKSLNRQAAATERLGDLLESLLPSPLTSDTLSGQDLKPAPAESFKTYDQREAYWDEVKKKRDKLHAFMEGD